MWPIDKTENHKHCILLGIIPAQCPKRTLLCVFEFLICMRLPSTMMHFSYSLFYFWLVGGARKNNLNYTERIWLASLHVFSVKIRIQTT